MISKSAFNMGCTRRDPEFESYFVFNRAGDLIEMQLH
jgi:hypothetical protein